MKIIDKPLDWLRPYKNNPRNNDKAVEPVANSIREFGFKVPIVATKLGRLIADNVYFVNVSTMEKSSTVTHDIKLHDF